MNKTRTIIITILVIVIALIVGIFAFYRNVGVNNNQATNYSNGASGIEGFVLIGPTPNCAVQMAQQSDCTQPFETTIIVKDKYGSEVTRFNSDVDGHFNVTLNPGAYVLYSNTGNAYPSLRPLGVDIVNNKFTNLNISFDSGIR